jgi:hypothetical protein
MGVGALDVARAETVQPYQQAALEAGQKSGGPERMALVRTRRLCRSARTQEGRDGSQQII